MERSAGHEFIDNYALSERDLAVPLDQLGDTRHKAQQGLAQIGILVSPTGGTAARDVNHTNE